MKNIKISDELFMLMWGYINDHYDPDDISRYRKIDAGIQAKISAMLRHEYYTASKTGKSEEIREQARQEYLDAAGIHSDFRW